LSEMCEKLREGDVMKFVSEITHKDEGKSVPEEKSPISRLSEIGVSRGNLRLRARSVLARSSARGDFVQEGAETVLVFFRGDEGGFFVAIAVDAEDRFRFARGGEDSLAHFGRNHWVLRAMNDEERGIDRGEAPRSIELSPDEEVRAGQEPKYFSCHCA